MGVLVCVICGSMVAQQTEVPAVQKPGLLSRLWEKYGFHQYTSGMTLASPYSLDHPPVYFPPNSPSGEEGVAAQQEPLTESVVIGPQGIVVSNPTVLATQAYLPEPQDATAQKWHSLVSQLESVRKQKSEVEQQEKKALEALKKEFEADQARLEEVRKRLVNLGVLKEPAASPSTSMLPNPF
jgi:hypothetical protein